MGDPGVLEWEKVKWAKRVDPRPQDRRRGTLARPPSVPYPWDDDEPPLLDEPRIAAPATFAIHA